MTRHRDLRELRNLASKYNLTYHGTTAKGHYRWLHAPTGRIITSISTLGTNWRSIANTERTFRRRLREIGVTDGHDSQD